MKIAIATGMQVLAQCLQKMNAYTCGYTHEYHAMRGAADIMHEMGKEAGMNIDNVVINGVHYDVSGDETPCHRDPDDWLTITVRSDVRTFEYMAIGTVYGVHVERVDDLDEYNEDAEAIGAELILFLEDLFMVYIDKNGHAGVRRALHVDREWLHTEVAQVLDSADYGDIPPMEL
jgi:hypothetical protein